MTQPQQGADIYKDMDLSDAIREIYRRKWIILFLTALAAGGAVAYSLQLPNVYESSSALIIRTPQRVITSVEEEPSTIQEQIPALDVEVVQSLAESTETQWTLFETLWNENKIPSIRQNAASMELGFQRFQMKLETELKRQQTQRSQGSALLPVLILTARAADPVEAESIANEWAKIVETKSRAVYTEGVTALGDFIGEMYEQSNTALGEFETALRKKTLEAGLDLKNVRLEAIKNKSNELEEGVFDLEIELAIDTVAIEEGQKRVNEQQVGGDWIGSVAEASLTSGQAYPFDVEELGSLAKDVVARVERKVSLMNELREYLLKNNLLGKQQEFKHLQTDIVRILGEKSVAEDLAPSYQAALDALNERIASIPQTVSLDKAITNDALWTAYLNNSLPADSDFKPLKSEELNPVYTKSMDIILELISESETSKGSSERLEQSAKEAAQALAELQSEIDIIEHEARRREAELEAVEGTLELLRQDYVDEMKRVQELVRSNLRTREELEMKREQRLTIAKDVDELEDDVSLFRQEIAVIQREVEKTQGVQGALASKAEAVALLEVSAENASRTGTTVLYEARANPLKVGPSRSRLVIMITGGAFLAACVLVCLAKLVRTPAP